MYMMKIFFFWIAQIQAIGHTTGQPKSRKKGVYFVKRSASTARLWRSV